MSRISRDDWAMLVAQVTARRSTCLRRRVGCVLLDVHGHILATGYNGAASGQPHCNEATGADGIGFLYGHACPGATAASGQSLDGCYAIHAEQNALMRCPSVSAVHTCYCTTAPCMTCTKMLLNTSCYRIVFLEEYVQPEAGRLWRFAGRLIERYSNENILASIDPDGV